MNFDFNLQNINRKRKLRRQLGFVLFRCRYHKNYSLQSVSRRTGLNPIIIDRIELGKGNVQWSDFLILMNFYGKDFSFEMEKIQAHSEELSFSRHSEELCSEESITT